MKRFISELFGTFCLVFCGAGSIITNDLSQGSISHVGISLTFGLIVMAMIFALGKISGAHINPAVSIAFYVSGNFNKNDLIPYILFQTLGAIFASGILFILFPTHISQGGTLPHDSHIQAFIIEFILTFILMFVIINVSSESKELGALAGISIGGVVCLESLFAGPITGASMNPARSLAPAIFSRNLDGLWIYLIAPVIGAIAAVYLYKIINESKLP
jgi:aquaporin Z